jgi:glycoside/pentoside/hexuronide:cation symporter, GPH family
VFGLKLGSGIGSWLSGEWLTFAGYSPTGEQSPAAIRAMVATISILPAVALLVGCVILFFYRIDDRLEQQIKEALRERRGSG